MGNCLFGFFAESPVVWEQKRKKKKPAARRGVCKGIFCLSLQSWDSTSPSFFPFYSTLMRRVSVREKKFGGPGYFRRLVGKRGRRKKEKKTCPCRKYCRKKGRHHHNPHIPRRYTVDLESFLETVKRRENQDDDPRIPLRCTMIFN